MSQDILAQKKSLTDRVVGDLQDELSSIKRGVRAAAKIGTPQQLTTQERQDLTNLGKRILIVTGSLGVIAAAGVGGYLAYKWRKKREIERIEAMEALLLSKEAPVPPTAMQPTRTAPIPPAKPERLRTPLPTPPAGPKTPALGSQAPILGWTKRGSKTIYQFPKPQQ